MRKLAFLFILFLLSFSAYAGKQIKSNVCWDISDVRAEVRGDGLHLTLKYHFITDGVISGGAVVLQPYLRYGKQSIELTPVSIYRLDRYGRSSVVRTDSRFASGNSSECGLISGVRKNYVTVESVVPKFKGVEKFDIVVGVQERKARNSVVFGPERVVASCTMSLPPVFEPRLFVLKPLYPAAVRTLSVPLCCRFTPDNKVDRNDPETASAFFAFGKSIMSIVGDPMTKVSSVTVNAWTGIDGKESVNKAKSLQRAKNVKALIQEKKPLDKKKVLANGCGEDWKTVNEFISNSFWYRDTGLRMALASGSADEREATIRNGYTELWSALARNVFMSLDRVEAVISFTVQPFKDADKLYLAYKNEPRLLAAVDFYELANARYREHSYEWNQVLLDAVNYWPEDEFTNINAVSILLENHRLNEVGNYIRGCGNNPYAKYFEATWLMMMGKAESAWGVISKVELPDHRTELEDVKGQIRSYLDWQKSTTPFDVVLFPEYSK